MRTLVVWVRDHLGFPGTLVLGVTDGRRLPLPILFLVPVVRFLGLCVGYFGGNVVVALRLLLLRVGDLLLIYPIFRLALFRVFDLPNVWIKKQ